jgi:hypothetical protein
MEVKGDEMTQDGMLPWAASKIVTVVKARKAYKCHACGMPIELGELHCTIVQGGGGLGWLKFPDRIHFRCFNKMLEEDKNDNRVN